MKSRTDARLIARPVLRPGLRVFRRDDKHLQVGIDDPRVVLPDSPGVRSLLHELQRGEGIGTLTPDAGLALGRLADAGALVGQAAVAAAQSDRRGWRAAALAAHGPNAPARIAARAACPVAVHAPEAWRAVVAERLVSVGVPVAHDGESGTVTLVVSVGEPARSLLDLLVHEDRPHLLVTLFAGHARLGPFVVPGVTACLRCVDAHLAESDPRRAVVLEQLEGAHPTSPHDPVLSHAAVALAVRELVAYAEGDRPATWSATLALGAALGEPMQTWTRHPHCGCSWG